MRTQPEVVAALRTATAPALLVGGTADALWHGATARELGQSYHGMETDDDPVRSAEILTRVTAELDRFVARLPAAGRPHKTVRSGATSAHRDGGRPGHP